MNRTGHIDWLPIQQAHTATLDRHTYVYAYWLADIKPGPGQDAGLGILKPPGAHPDWFIHADHADTHLSAAVDNNVIRVSDTYYDVFERSGRAFPLLGAVLLGTASFALQGWSCGREHLSRAGQNMMRKLDGLYLRPGVIVTFQQTPADESVRPRVSHDSATVQLPRGAPRTSSAQPH